MRKLLRQTWSGHIYVWTENLANRPDMEPYEDSPQHHVLVPDGKLQISATGSLSVEDQDQKNLVSNEDAQQIAKTLFRRKPRKAA